MGNMDNANVGALFILGVLLIVWTIGSIQARERLLGAGPVPTGLNIAGFVGLTLVAAPAIAVVWALQQVGHLLPFTRKALRILATSVRSFLKAAVRKAGRIWSRYRRRRRSPLQEPDLEMSTPSNHNASARPFLLGIPAELRSKIYRFTVEHYDILDCRPTLLLRPRKQFRHAMALIRTCRQIYDEAHMVVYGFTLFHVWTRHPFYRQLKPAIWNEIKEVHLAAEINSRGSSNLAAALRDLDHMLGLRDLYITVGNFRDFEENYRNLISIFSRLRHRLKDLSLIQVNTKCPRKEDYQANRSLKKLLVCAVLQGAWPADKEVGIMRTLFGKFTRWRAFVKLPGYKVTRQIGWDEDLVPLPWDGYTY